MSPDIVASVRARLLNQAREQREEYERTLVRYADERLLYRLGESAARERCILKGAIFSRFGCPTRTAPLATLTC